MIKNILIVEERNNASLMIQKCIEDLKFNISATLKYDKDAIEKIHAIKPDIVIMDIDTDKALSNMGHIHYINKNLYIPIIITTSVDMQSREEFIKHFDPLTCLTKPIKKEQLKDTLEKVLLEHNYHKKAEDNELKFATILNSIEDAVIVIDEDNTITYMNPVAIEMTDSEGRGTGEYLHDVISIEDKIFDSFKYNRFHFHDGDYHFSYLITRKNKKIPIDFSVSPQKDNKGNSIGTIFIIRDISEQVLSAQHIQRSFEQLRKAMGGVIQAMASTFESRDPYTAGHQRRVADLARQIATEMRLSNTMTEGIRMAGTIHDLGKISSPTEILSKPGKLTDLEFQLIKLHPENAYHILKPIDFPWPVADIVYQHHERLNGSGYPRGLAGNEILLEARILAVADVVEAMTFHRPYRPALGIEMALEEIVQHKNSLYDYNVVQACISLFNEKGYTMVYGM